ncbi:MAG: hypothetical protein FWG90_14105 [Oscillospiraceae bacterium]|nr:hypothetical protein [Oscillospiraceae bacterium]
MEKKNGFAKRALLEASKIMLDFAPAMATEELAKPALWGEEICPAHLMSEKQD